jgi:hypothetical protein
MTIGQLRRARHILSRVRRVGGKASVAGGYVHCRLPDNSEGYELLVEIRNSRAAVIANLRASGSVEQHRRRTPTMTNQSEPLENVLMRARRGESATAGLGPFFILISWPSSSRKMICPIAFESVEAAAQRAVECFPALEETLGDDFVLNICIRSGSSLLQ